MKYFVMVGEGVAPVAPIKKNRDRKSFPKRRWLDGVKLNFSIERPVVYELDPLFPGNPKVLYSGQPIPVMRDDLYDALCSLGVDNLEAFPAILVDEGSGKEYTNYKSFNVVGKVSAADMAASTRMGVSESDMISVDFDRLVIDKQRAAGLHLFRLAENVSAIVVDEVVKKNVEDRGIPGVFFYGSGEWSG